MRRHHMPSLLCEHPEVLLAVLWGTEPTEKHIVQALIYKIKKTKFALYGAY